MDKCVIQTAQPADVEALSVLKVQCSQANYRGYFPYAPMAETDIAKAQLLFKESIQSTDAQVLMLYCADRLSGYSIARPRLMDDGEQKGEILLLDTLPNTPDADMMRLVAHTVIGISTIQTSCVFIHLLRNNYRARYAFEQVGFHKLGKPIKRVIHNETFDLLPYVYKLPTRT